MKEIQGVKLEPARNAAHYELVHSILEFAEKCQAVTENMAEALAALKAAVDHEGYLLGISLKSEHTERLEITGRERDGFVSAGKGLVNALMKNPDAAGESAGTVARRTSRRRGRRIRGARLAALRRDRRTGRRFCCCSTTGRTGMWL